MLRICLAVRPGLLRTRGCILTQFSASQTCSRAVSTAASTLLARASWTQMSTKSARFLSTSFNSNQGKDAAGKADAAADANGAKLADSAAASGSVGSSSLGSSSGQQEPVAVTIERELPDPFVARKQNRLYFVAYAVGITLACVFIFNYEKTGSPVINSVLYFLRRSEHAKEVLGEDIAFAQQWPWIWGQLNTVQGRVDIEFSVKGTKNEGTIRLKADRHLKVDPFHIHWWTLEYVDGASGESKKLDLLKDSSIDFGL